MVNSTAGTDQATASQRVVSTSASATSASTTPTITASLTETWPDVMGRCVVRFTCLSKSRSAMSLMQQPALRISTVPSTNTASRCQPGKPSAATHSAASVGQTSTSQPAGRFQRIRSRYSASRERGAAGGGVEEEEAACDMGSGGKQGYRSQCSADLAAGKAIQRAPA
jgi:hypothetical protein